MPRLNKVTEKVFAEIAETSKKKGAYRAFLEIDKELGLYESNKLKSFKNQYALLAEKSSDDIQTLATLEEIIIQMRAKLVINSELRLSLSRNYIYARSLFFRRGNKINDIRVVAGTTEEFGDDLNKLFTDESFRAICTTKLEDAIDKEIERNVSQLKSVIA